jgi:hypothetical protein
MIDSGGLLGPAGNLDRQRRLGCAGLFSLWASQRNASNALGAASRRVLRLKQPRQRAQIPPYLIWWPASISFRRRAMTVRARM